MDDEIKLLFEFNENDFTAQHQIELYQYWDKLKQGRIIPARSDIKVEDLKKNLPSLMLLDFNREKETFTFRLIGTACVKFYGELTGKVMNDYEEHSQAVKRLLWCV
ncbi:MAG: PAS domain-containing protein [Kordiimonadaceae bacterium]|nr:PAS domain-containing protein [Kordiimonadaceae bacterium]